MSVREVPTFEEFYALAVLSAPETKQSHGWFMGCISDSLKPYNSDSWAIVCAGAMPWR